MDIVDNQLAILVADARDAEAQMIEAVDDLECVGAATRRAIAAAQEAREALHRYLDTCFAGSGK